VVVWEALVLLLLLLQDTTKVAAFHSQQQQQQRNPLSYSHDNTNYHYFVCVSDTRRTKPTVLFSVQESTIHVNAGFNQSPRQISISHDSSNNSIINNRSINNNNNNNQTIAPVYITIGPPCAGKTRALALCLQRDGYDPETVLSQKDVALDEQSNVYVRVPLAAFIFPRTRLDETTMIGGTMLQSGTTLRDRLLDPPTKNLENTDIELRNVILRVAGRMTPQDFANKTRQQALEAGDNVKFFRKRRMEVAEDLIRGVEQVSVRAVGEVLFQMQLEQEEEQQQKQQQKQQEEIEEPSSSLAKVVVPFVENDDDLPYDHQEESKDEQGTDSEAPLDLNTINATSAHLLSAKALIKTPYVELFVPHALFNGGIERAETQLQRLLDSSDPTTPISWGNTNTRPIEYATALNAAQKAGRPVKFVAWGTPNLPRLPRQELLRRTVSKFRNTGRYVPAGAVGAALGRVERLIQEAEKEAKTLASHHRHQKEQHQVESTRDKDCSTVNSCFDEQMNKYEEENQRMNVALAALAGFVMDDEGRVMKVTEPRNLNQKAGRPKSNKMAQHLQEPSEKNKLGSY